MIATPRVTFRAILGGPLLHSRNPHSTHTHTHSEFILAKNQLSYPPGEPPIVQAWYTHTPRTLVRAKPDAEPFSGQSTREEGLVAVPPRSVCSRSATSYLQARAVPLHSMAQLAGLEAERLHE